MPGRNISDRDVEAISGGRGEIVHFYRVSGVTGAGVPQLLEAMWEHLAFSGQAANDVGARVQVERSAGGDVRREQVGTGPHEPKR